MTKNNTAIKDQAPNLAGRIIDGFTCQSFYYFRDIVVLINDRGETAVYSVKDIETQPKQYKIKSKKVDKAIVTEDLSALVLETSDGIYYRDKNNRKIRGSEAWADYYIEPYTSIFFRMDKGGRWHDIQGHRIGAPFMIVGQVLCSIPGKSSIKSPFFKDQALFTNPKNTMVQVGKVVYDIDLNLLDYMGEKITSIGIESFAFKEEESYRSVNLGLHKKGFIHEQTFEPLLINGEEIRSIVSVRKIEKNTYFVLSSDHNEYTLVNDLGYVLTYNGQPLKSDLDSFINFGDYSALRVSSGKHSYYWSIQERKPLDLLGEGKPIISIDLQKNKIGAQDVINLAYAHKKMSYSIYESNVFRLANDGIIPESVESIPYLEKHLFFASIDGTKKLCRASTKEVLRFEDGSIEISQIDFVPGSKLVNAISTEGESMVLDFRFGLDDCKLAKVGAKRLVLAIGNSASVGGAMLQNVELQTLGGSTRRVVNLNEKDLQEFKLPSDLKAYSEQSKLSVYAESIVVSVDFENRTILGTQTFLNGKILTFLNEQKDLVLQEENGRPLQLDGVGHRNEMVQVFDKASLKKSYYLSSHRMIRVQTLTEDHKTSSLMFSLNTMSSWLPFYDTYLPILKSLIDLSAEKQWEYHLFEVHNMSTEKEYIAVEKRRPYRVLADKSRNKYIPRIVKSREIILKSPEEISTLRRFFSNPGHLVEIG